MEISKLAEIAVRIVIHVLDKSTEGALSEVGAQVVHFLREKFQIFPELVSSQDKQELLEAQIVSEASKDANFRDRLEDLVRVYETRERNINIFQSTESGVNASAPGGTINIDNRKEFFRQ